MKGKILTSAGEIWFKRSVRQGRLKAPPGHAIAYYHCISRVVDRRFIFGEVERERFVRLMREYEAFCGVRIVTYAILSNHFHLLLAVPQRPTLMPNDEELLVKIEALSGTAGSGLTRQRLEQWRRDGQHQAAEALRQRYLARMWDLSAFMKLLKQRFTQGYNREHGRKGTLWEERFKSVLVEGAGETLATMAAYIDLNAVRAGLTHDSKEYRWCGYGAAMGADAKALDGLREVVAALQGVSLEQAKELKAEEVRANYRVWLYEQGEENEGLDQAGRPLRKGFAREQVAEVVAQKGRVSRGQYLRLRVRYFTDGAVLGSRQYVNEVFAALRSRFGPRRRDGARRMKGLEAPSLYTLRNLRLRVAQ